MFKWKMPLLVSALLGITSIVGHTAVFSIVPKAGTSLPTHVGGSIKALYTVTNTTGSFHAGNYVKYLPTNTTQVTVDSTYSDLCGATFQLEPQASCTLELNVTGAVNAYDPNPKDHLFVCLGGCVTCCAGTNVPLKVIENNPIYTAVIDAGSSGTRLSFFKVVPGSGGYPIIDKIATYDNDDDGINDFLNGNGSIDAGEPLPPGCPAYTGLNQLQVEPCVIQPLLNQLDGEIALLNSSNPGLNLTQSQVKVELFATAGMRTEDTRNGGAFDTSYIDNYYNQMKTYVAQWGYGVGEFKTINGNSEEGVWTWTNLNDYYYNSFGGNTTQSQTVQYPVGDFEVGGSSIQIAFPTNDSPSAPPNNIYRVAINGYTFNVYSKSFLGLGGDDARKYVKANAYSNNVGGAVCYSSTANQYNTKEKSGIQLYPSSQALSDYPFPDNSDHSGTPWTTVPNIPTETYVGSLLLVGPPAYNVVSCSSLYDTTVNQVTSLTRNNYGTFNEGPPATMASFQTAIKASYSPFVGIDNFFFTSNDLGYAVSTGFDPSIFQTKLNDYCTGNSVPPTTDKQNACPNGNFMNAYLFGPFGLFHGITTPVFAGVQNPVVNRVTVLTWTRGYLLLKYAN